MLSPGYVTTMESFVPQCNIGKKDTLCKLFNRFLKTPWLTQKGKRGCVPRLPFSLRPMTPLPHGMTKVSAEGDLFMTLFCQGC